MFLVEKIKDATQNFFKGIFRFWYLKIKYPLYYRLCARHPVDARKVVFIENRFRTLTSSFALIHRRIFREYDCVVKDCFVLEKQGKRRDYNRRCMAMIREVASAKYVFVDDSSRVVGALPIRPETHLTQLWHACGAFKKWGFSNAEGKFGATHRQMRRYPYYAKYNLMTVSSEEVRWAYSEAFGLPPENDVVRATGVSRTDVFFDPAFRASAYETLYRKIPQARGKKVILYAPTFRGTIGEASAPKDLQEHLLFERLGEGYILIYKQHPSVKEQTIPSADLADRVFDMTQEMSIEQLLTVSDVCVTDYSSVIFEYSLFARPILIYAFDLEEYTDWRGFYYPFAEFVPGPIVKNTQELADCIKDLDHYDLQKVRDFCKKYMGACDGHATDRILDAVFGEELPKRMVDRGERSRTDVKVSVIVPVYNVEKYIRETLESIRRQTLANFEVLVVNDGSTDGSQEIIADFCALDGRFHSFQKKNGGVSEARNFALDRAVGEYVFFVDGDDRVPPESLETLYWRAKEKDADMVVGIMQEFGVYGARILQATEDLAKKSAIDRYDPRMHWIFSVCNKLFRRAVIEQNHLRFEKVRYTEDGLFSFQFTFASRTITGCETVAYLYRRRSFWNENSVTQAATAEYLRDLLTALDKLLALVRAQNAVAIQEAKEKDDGTCLYLDYAKSHMPLYLAELYRKIIRVQFLKGFYRQLWKSDDEMFPLLEKSILQYRTQLFPGMWQAITRAEADLRLERGILTKEDLARQPLVTVAISDRVPGSCLNRVLESFYCQSFPAFALVVHARQKEYVDPRYLARKNLTLLEEDMDTGAFKNRVLDEAASPYLAFLDEPVYMGQATYENIYRTLEQHKEVDFVSCLLKLVNEAGKVESCPMHEVCFLVSRLPKRFWRYRAIDWPLGHKLFRTKSLRAKKVRFSNDSAKDSALCYKKLNPATTGKYFMLIDLSKKEFQKRVRPFARLTWKRAYDRLLEMSEAGRQSKLLEQQRRVWARKRKLIQKAPTLQKVLFATDGSDVLPENLQAVYDALDAKKCVWAHAGQSGKNLPSLYWQLFTSKVIVAQDTFGCLKSFRLKPAQKVVQIWHGAGQAQKFGLDGPLTEIGSRLYHERYNVVAAGGPGARAQFASAFGIYPNVVAPLGVPQTDKWFDKAYAEREKAAFAAAYPQLAGKRVFLYMPAYRPDPEKRVKLNLDRLQAWLGETGVFLVCPDPRWKSDFLKGRTLPNVWRVPYGERDRALLSCDVLIADIGQVVFDAALLRKPLVRFCPDLDTCVQMSYQSVWEDLYGEVAETQEALQEACARAFAQPDFAKLPAFVETYLSGCDGHSAKRVAGRILELLKEP